MKRSSFAFAIYAFAGLIAYGNGYGAPSSNKDRSFRIEATIFAEVEHRRIAAQYFGNSEMFVRDSLVIEMAYSEEQILYRILSPTAGKRLPTDPSRRKAARWLTSNAATFFDFRDGSKPLDEVPESGRYYYDGGEKSQFDLIFRGISGSQRGNQPRNVLIKFTRPVYIDVPGLSRETLFLETHYLQVNDRGAPKILCYEIRRVRPNDERAFREHQLPANDVAYSFGRLTQKESFFSIAKTPKSDQMEVELNILPKGSNLFVSSFRDTETFDRLARGLPIEFQRPNSSSDALTPGWPKFIPSINAVKLPAALTTAGLLGMIFGAKLAPEPGHKPEIQIQVQERVRTVEVVREPEVKVILSRIGEVLGKSVEEGRVAEFVASEVTVLCNSLAEHLPEDQRRRVLELRRLAYETKVVAATHHDFSPLTLEASSNLFAQLRQLEPVIKDGLSRQKTAGSAEQLTVIISEFERRFPGLVPTCSDAFLGN
jgi:hypothetical protein